MSICLEALVALTQTQVINILTRAESPLLFSKSPNVPIQSLYIPRFYQVFQLNMPEPSEINKGDFKGSVKHAY